MKPLLILAGLLILAVIVRLLREPELELDPLASPWYA